MGNTLKQPKSTIYILIALIILGIGIRCLNIDNIYSHDEVYTSFRINGHISGRVEKNIEGKALFSEQIKEFQSHDGTTWKEAFNAFSTRPEHPPLFFALERVWTDVFGDSIIALRSLPVIFGVVTIPVVFWFCLELFESSSIGLISAAFVAVSPFHALYSQYARAYSLWILLTFISGIATLQFLKKDNKQNYLFLLLTTITSLYTHVLSITFIGAQLLYVGWHEKFKATKKAKLFLSQAFLGGIVLLGWFILCSIINSENLFDSVKTVESVTGDFTMNRLRIFQLLGLHFSSLFVQMTRLGGIPREIYLLFLGLVLVGILASYLFLLKTQNKERVFFILFAVCFSVLPIVMKDLFDLGVGSKNSRYFCPAIMITVVVVAYAVDFIRKSDVDWIQLTGDLILCTLLFVGVISCFSRDDINFSHVPHVSKYLNSQVSPTVYAGKLVNLIAVADKSEEDTSFVFLKESIEDIGKDNLLAKNSFVFEPNQTMVNYFENNKELTLAPVLGNGFYLFKVEENESS